MEWVESGLLSTRFSPQETTVENPGYQGDLDVIGRWGLGIEFSVLEVSLCLQRS